MATLITGAAGFIGSHLAEALVARGEEVVGLDEFNDYYAPALKRDNLAALLRSAAFTIVEGSLLDPCAVDRAFSARPIERVVHLAARAGVRPSLEDPVLYASVNVTGTFGLLEACRARGVRRFTFASSSSVYGRNPKLPFSEEDPLKGPASPYGATKEVGEKIVKLYCEMYGFQATALRFFTVYGPRQRPDMAIHKFASLIDRGLDVPVFGDGTSARDYTYVEDIVRGLRAAMDLPHGFEVFNLGNSRTVPLARMIALLEEGLGRAARLRRLPEAMGDVPATFADVSKARRLLGFEPATPIEIGIPLFLDWYRSRKAAGLLPVPAEGSPRQKMTNDEIRMTKE